MGQGDFHIASAFRRSPNAILVIDAVDGTLVDANPALERILGCAVCAGEPISNVFGTDLTDFLTRLALDGHADLDTCVGGHAQRLHGEMFEFCGRQLIFALMLPDDIARLRQSEALYRTLIDHCRDGVLLVQNGRVQFTNPAMADMLNYSRAELVGIEYIQLVAPDSREAQMQWHAVREGDSYGVQDYEVVLRRKGGDERYMQVRAAAVEHEGGIASIGTIRDITDACRQQAQLAEAEARYRHLVEHSQVGVYLMLGDRYTYVNKAFATMFGYAEHELIGESFRRLVPPESQQHVEARYRRQCEAESYGGSYSVTLMSKNGNRIDVVVNAGPVELDGHRYISGTIRDVTEQRRFQRELEHNATHDCLTGLPSRFLVERALGARLKDALAATCYEYAVLFLDLDGFKLVNNSLGHAAGDELLLAIAERLRNSFEGEGLVARYGGDEFTILPDGLCPRFRAEALARRVLGLFSDPFTIRGHTVYSGASVGIVLGHPDYQAPDQVLRDADTAMYRAKAAGKAAYVVFDEAMHLAARARLTLETDLRGAIDRAEFCVFYQPIVDLGSGSVIGCEALVRWQHPERGLLPPPEFLAAAEESGLIVPLDWWVLEHACRQLLTWQRRYPAFGTLRINVNLDERQFAERHLARLLGEVLDRVGLEPTSLALEVTETVFRRGRRDVEETLWQLKELGPLLVVDDFGTGYSSLESFTSAPFDALKIDRSFICDMETNPRHRAIVRTITGFADELGLLLTAEGVETPGQAQLLLSMGCGSAQGFLYARPMPPETFDEVLAVGLALQHRA